ncbi:uncharacterized protein MONOS_9438 [Monocercomonoides exilis]|uniref:uncharacterized protein n=1 Tax=Monocercomonoides exilis TaxID=2049356 RepID=UPI0035597769|nr:hypothetical protein MONOS_9438 [Monocercomonoides exilis]|eukprot:MONOS_9438.1-p1 / transcript=MONOS_9438.1 / gene=MONOS_9438 / organism=Monocercomonoides_exilis_PA203 / gene_product=unspecified product / transcript_product=unspecified product / location=Mono_scaffold00390:21153-25229(+) / protein_length=1359 / sequence_SO=supercontig / SO=protein_coding / is_pseudo=false
MFLILILLNYLFAGSLVLQSDNKNRLNAFTDDWDEEAVNTVFISERGDDSKPNCGSETQPCKTIAKGIELLGDDPVDKTLKFFDFAEIQYEFLFSKDFNLVITTVLDKNARGRLDFDLKNLVENRKYHMINEKKLTLEHLTFNLIPYKTEPHSTETDEESAVILSKGAYGDLKISDCGIYFKKWTKEYAPFSILRVTEGKIYFDTFDWNSDNVGYLSEKTLMHISEGVSLQKLKGFKFRQATLSEECALALPSSFSLEGSDFSSIERKTAGPAMLEAKSDANKRVEISISKCSFFSQSPLSERGGCLYFEMTHPESELNIIDTTFSSGKAAKGGGMMIGMSKGKAKLENVKFSGCMAAEGGGGLYVLELMQMAGFECINVSFENCKAQSGGGVFLTLDEEDEKGDGTFFKDCFFVKNEASNLANDVMIGCKGNSEMNKNPFDAACISSTKKERVVVKKQSNTSIIHDDWLIYSSLEVDVDAANGVDNDECGKEGNKPCKTIKKAIENSLSGRLFRIYTTEDCNEYDSEPIAIENRQVKISRRENSKKISITTALDETKVLPGEGLFNVKRKGKFHLSGADVKVDTTRASGRSNGLIVEDGEDASVELVGTNITSEDVKQELNCVLIEIKSGALRFGSVQISYFTSAFALIISEASKSFVFFQFTFDTISVSSPTQSVVTILDGSESVSMLFGRMKNCLSPQHGMGGCFYVEVGSSADDYFHDIRFDNCSCQSATQKSEVQYRQQNEESKGGAIFVQVVDGMNDPLKLSFKCLTFLNCAAVRGEYIYLSLPVGREQIQEDVLETEMEAIYGKPNFVLLEERKGDETNIIDLLTDETNKLPYYSQNIYVGGDHASKAQTCGRRAEPCDRIDTGIKHKILSGLFCMQVIGVVSVDEPFETKQSMTFASSPDSSSSSSSLLNAEPNRGVLHVEAKIYYGLSKAVFDSSSGLCEYRHLDFEYPDAVEGDAVDLIYSTYILKMIDVVFRPWYTGLKGESVLGGEGKPLPYKLIVIEKEFGDFKQLAIYGRNGNTNKGRRADESKKSKKNEYFSEMKVEKAKSEPINKDKDDETENGLCLWNSGLVTLLNTQTIDFEECSFINISDGAIFSDESSIDLYKCSFEGNHPIGENWEKFPSFRHSIIFLGKEGNRNANIRYLAEGSDGLNGKPFGMLSDTNIKGQATENIDSLFFSPALQNVKIVKGAEVANRRKEANGKEEENEEETVTGIIHGSYLFPCELTFEVAKERKGDELKWVECPITEFVDEKEMKVKIPKELLDVDEQTSVICHLSYSSGITTNEKKYTENWFLVKPKDNTKKLTRTQLIIIISSTCAFAVVATVIVVIVVCAVKRKKKREYKEIKDGTK